ncbi:MAG: hypothetical protein F6K39_27935 [Okeania sp. SIO3B3]|nr:hypothetical protein [Okeania sp. SIO3B3]
MFPVPFSLFWWRCLKKIIPDIAEGRRHPPLPPDDAGGGRRKNLALSEF